MMFDQISLKFDQFNIILNIIKKQTLFEILIKLTSILSFVNKSLMISTLFLSTALYNAVELIYYL